MSIDRIHVSNQGIENHRSVDRGQEARDKEKAGNNSERSSTPSKGDSVELSSKAREMGRISKLASEVTDRTDRINQVREAIQNGTYRVSGEDIANKIIEAHKK